MDRLRGVLVAVDFSPCSLDALRQALRVASWTGASLRAVHVVEPIWYGAELAALVPSPQALAARAQERWRALAGVVPGVERVSLTVVSGHACASILAQVAAQPSEPIDLLVLGEHSVLDKHRTLGHIAAGCAQRAGCKVLLVREGQGGAFRSVIACVDFSPTSLDAVEQGVRVAMQDGASLRLLHVAPHPFGGGPAPAEVVRTMPEWDVHYRAALHARVIEFLKPLEHDVRAARGEVDIVIGSHHGAAIIDRAQATGADLIVLGTRGSWNIRDVFMGSTAERIVRAAPCSVLAIKPRGFVQQAVS